MKRVKAVLNNSKYKNYLDKINNLEKNREFCCHDIHHFVSTARLAYLFSLKSKVNLPKDVIYAAGLLHDIGRFKQYEEEKDHALAGAELAESILKESGFTFKEREMICTAIKEHRLKEGKSLSTPLSKFLWKGDKYSRLCFSCKAKEICNKFEEMPHNSFLFF